MLVECKKVNSMCTMHCMFRTPVWPRYEAAASKVLGLARVYITIDKKQANGTFQSKHDANARSSEEEAIAQAERVMILHKLL